MSSKQVIVLIEWRLAEIMARRRITGNAVAEAIGVKPNSVSRMKRKPTMPRLEPEVLDRLCKCLECQPGDLMVHVEEADRE